MKSLVLHLSEDEHFMSILKPSIIEQKVSCCPETLSILGVNVLKLDCLALSFAQRKSSKIRSDNDSVHLCRIIFLYSFEKLIPYRSIWNSVFAELIIPVICLQFRERWNLSFDFCEILSLILICKTGCFVLMDQRRSMISILRSNNCSS